MLAPQGLFAYGGSSFSTTVNVAEATEIVSAGVTSDTTLNFGVGNLSLGGVYVGDMYVQSGSAIGTTVDNGGTQVVLWGDFGGGQEFGYGGLAISTTVSSGGTEIVDGGSAISTTVNSGGTEIVDGGTAISTTVALGGSIDLVGLTYVSGGTASVTSDDVLSVTVGGNSYTQQPVGDYAGKSLQLAPGIGAAPRPRWRCHAIEMARVS